MRQVPDDFAIGAVTEIDQRLTDIARTEGVHYVAAVESGSRAWGFPSPDSDYDCRFIYVRSRDEYLTPWLPRDVIETPLVDLIDLNGWDVTKAIKLLLKGNAVVLEWLVSPIVYRGDRQARAILLDLAKDHVDAAAIVRHYLHLGRRQQRLHAEGGELRSLKKAFYILRPALALRWLRLHAPANVPPMHLPTLAQEVGLAACEAAAVGELVARKAQAREDATSPLPSILATLIEDEFGRAESSADEGRAEPAAGRAAGAAAFRRILALAHREA